MKSFRFFFIVLSVFIALAGCGSDDGEEMLTIDRHAFVKGLMPTGMTICQAVDLPNGKVFFLGISENGPPVEPQIYDPRTNSFNPAANKMSSLRKYATVTALKNGKVLITGGIADEEVISSAELYDPETNRFSLSGGMLSEKRSVHTAILLDDGTVLIAGGEDGSVQFDTAEIYSPDTDQFISLGTRMNDQRTGHTAIKLKDGKVLIMGGFNNDEGMLQTAEVYDPLSGIFKPTSGTMNVIRGFGLAVSLLADGRVLITGGDGPIGQPNLTSAELFDPVSGTFIPLASSMNVPRRLHFSIPMPDGRHVLIGGGFMNLFANSTGILELFDSQTETFTELDESLIYERGFMKEAVVRLQNGKILIVGGTTTGLNAIALPNAELLNPADFSSTLTGGMHDIRRWHTASLLKDGTVLIAGGMKQDLVSGNPILSSSEVFNPLTGLFVSTSSTMTEMRAFHTATLLHDDNVLIAGGTAGSNTAELYNVETGKFEMLNGQMATARVGGHTATLLHDGTVLIAGGADGDMDVLSTAEIYDPFTMTFIETQGNMTTPRTSHTAVLLHDGRVFICGGSQTFTISTTLSSAELYDPVSRIFIPVSSSMTSTRTLHSATLIHDGKVLIAGGENAMEQILTSAEVFTPSTESFNSVSGDLLSAPRAYHTSIDLDNGKIMLIGGDASREKTNASYDIYDPILDRFTLAGSMNFARRGHTSTLLRNGTILVTGGDFFSIGSRIPVTNVELIGE